MKYPSPRRILEFLSCHGPSTVQAEAIAVLARNELPERWPSYERHSHEAFLRRLASNSKKSARARLDALRELLAIARPAEQSSPTQSSPAQIDDELWRLLNDPRELERGSKLAPESIATKPQEVPSKVAPVPADEVSSTPAALAGQLPVAPARDTPTRDTQAFSYPKWFPVDDASEDAARFVNKLATQRHRETFDVEHWDLLSRGLAAQRSREKKSKTRLDGMPTCGGELSD